MSYPNHPEPYGAPPSNAGQPIHIGFAPYTKFSTTSAPLPNTDGTSSFFSNSGVAGVAGPSSVLAAGVTAAGVPRIGAPASSLILPNGGQSPSHYRPRSR
jgi:hypothetical protein